MAGRQVLRLCGVLATGLVLLSGDQALAQDTPAKGKHKNHSPAVGAQKTADAYQCPMKCEGAKTYSAPGKCPVCSMNLKKITAAKYAVEVKATLPIRAGEPASLVIAIKDPQGKPVTKLETVHEKILHLLVVSKDLSWFAHEHPELRPDGTLRVAFAFPAPGEYMLYHDFTPPGVGQQVVRAMVSVPGTAPSPVPLTLDGPGAKVVDGYSVTLRTKKPLRVNEEAELDFEVSKDGKPVTDLQPYLGAMGHLVIISQDLEHFVHSHPLEKSGAAGHSDAKPGAHQHGASAAAAAAGGPEVRFHAHFEAPGLYKAWGQFQRGGKVLTVPVVVKVEESASPASGGAHQH